MMTLTNILKTKKSKHNVNDQAAPADTGAVLLLPDGVLDMFGRDFMLVERDETER